MQLFEFMNVGMHVTEENRPYAERRRPRPDCACAQSGQGLRCSLCQFKKIKIVFRLTAKNWLDCKEVPGGFESPLIEYEIWTFFPAALFFNTVPVKDYAKSWNLVMI